MVNQMLLVGNVFVSEDYGNVNQRRVGCGIGWANFEGRKMIGRVSVAPPGKKSELGLAETRHLFQTHFTAQLGHRVDNHQAAHAFLQLAHVGLFFLGDRTAERQV